jgi:hypothetical protein
MNTQNMLREAAHLALVERVMRVMDHVEYRRVRTVEDLEAVVALRQRAYRAHNVYVRDDQPMTDAQDLDPRFFTFAVYLHEELLATLRVHIVTAANPECNSLHYFPDVLMPLVGQGLTFMDPTRFAIDPDLGTDVPGLPLITLRLGFLAAKHFETDYCLSMIKEQHQKFYRKVFRSTQLTPFLAFEAVHARYALFSSPKTMEDVICQAFPLFRSTPTERKLLFAEPAKGAPAVLSVQPSARLATRQRGAINGQIADRIKAGFAGLAAR